MGGDELELIIGTLGLDDVKGWLATLCFFSMAWSAKTHLPKIFVALSNLDQTIEENTDALIENTRHHANNSKFQ